MPDDESKATGGRLENKAERDRLVAKLKRKVGWPEHGEPTPAFLTDLQRRLDDPGNVGVLHAIFLAAWDGSRLTLPSAANVEGTKKPRP